MSDPVATWKEIEHELAIRHATLSRVATDLHKMTEVPGLAGLDFSPRRRLTLAATDVFVEKAQRTLAVRAYSLMTFGVIGATIALFAMVAAAYLIFSQPLATFIDNTPVKELNASIVTLIIVKATAAGTLLATAAVFLMHLARALFHEATILLNRRHALRFGRLFVYLKDGQISLKDLESAFKWNDEFSTAFRDISIAQIAPKSAIQQVTDGAAQAANGAAKAANRVRGNRKSPVPGSAQPDA